MHKTARMTVLLLALALTPGGCGVVGDGAADATGTLEVTWLANEGALISAGGKRVLIDAFVPEEYSIYTALPEAVAAAMLEGAPPFDGVIVALVSHVHADHFQPEFAREVLARRDEIVLVSSPQVQATGALAGRAEVRLPAPGQSAFWSGHGVDVEFLNLSHGSGRVAEIQNLGHIVTIDGYRVLHIGDAAMDPENFAPYRLADRDLHVALIPYWYFSSAEGRQIVEEHLVADLRIAVHLPRAGRDDETLDAARADGRAAVPERALQSWRIGRQPGP